MLLSMPTTAVNILNHSSKSISSQTIQPKVTLDGDIITKTGGYKDRISSSVALQYCGRLWHEKWDMWWYTFNVSWYEIKYGKNGNMEEYPYVSLEVDLSVDTEGLVKNSADLIDVGGWNVTKLRDSGDFEKWAAIICDYLLLALPGSYSLYFSNGLKLAQALCDTTTSDPSKPTYKWEGRQTKEAAGFAKFHCLVEPDTDFSLRFNFDYWSSSLDDSNRPYREWNLNLKWEDTSPASPKPHIKITKPQANQLYLFDRSLMPLNTMTAVIGAVTIHGDAYAEFGVTEVRYIVEETLEGVCEQPPYEWHFDGYGFGKYTIKLEAYTEVPTTTSSKQVLWSSDEITFFFFPIF